MFADTECITEQVREMLDEVGVDMARKAVRDAEMPRIIAFMIDHIGEKHGPDIQLTLDELDETGMFVLMNLRKKPQGVTLHVSYVHPRRPARGACHHIVACHAGFDFVDNTADNETPPFIAFWHRRVPVPPGLAAEVAIEVLAGTPFGEYARGLACFHYVPDGELFRTVRRVELDYSPTEDDQVTLRGLFEAATAKFVYLMALKTEPVKLLGILSGTDWAWYLGQDLSGLTGDHAIYV